jgi:cell division protein ZapA (FtsZ GTPase activity inhibitor)
MAERERLEAAMLSGAINALRRRADALRQRASVGVTILDRKPPVVIVESKAAHLYRIARDLERVASDLEAEAT